VPGCSGNDSSRNDYCIREFNPSLITPQLTSQPTVQTTPSPTSPPIVYKTEYPTTMPVTVHVSSPSYTPMNAPSSLLDTYTAVSPATMSVDIPSTPLMVGRTIAEPIPLVMTGWYSGVPLQMCQGDCGADNECAEGLICYMREAYEAVPGCLGGESDSTSLDYCTTDPSDQSVPIITNTPTFTIPPPAMIPPPSTLQLETMVSR
jgi:hypothetical protein